MKTINLSERQMEILHDLVESSIDSLEDYQRDVGDLTKKEKKELSDLYELLYDLSINNLNI